MDKINKILFTNFKKEFENYKSILGVNDYEYNNAIKNKKWIGNNLCGPSTVICCYLLKKYKYKVYKNVYGFGYYQEDHTFIIIDDYIYVDPTYLQFINNNNSLPCFYIGTYDDLKLIINSNSELNLMKLWDKTNDITDKVNKFINKYFDKKTIL